MNIYRVEFRGLFRSDLGFEFVASDSQENAQKIAIKLFGTLYNPIITKEIQTCKIGPTSKNSVHAYDENGEKVKFEFA